LTQSSQAHTYEVWCRITPNDKSLRENPEKGKKKR
jgi:hypothetical protein